LRGGPSFVLRTLAQGLAAAGCEVEVACTDDNGPRRLPPPVSRPVREDGIPFWYFPRQLGFYTVSLPFWPWIRGAARRFDLIHIHALFSYCPTVAALAARQSAVPYIVRPLGVLNQWGVANRRPRLKQLSLRYLEGPIIAGAAAMHFTSELERQEAARLGYPFYSAVIPNPVVLPRAVKRSGFLRSRYPELRDKVVLLFLSRVDRKKGLDLLFPAVAGLRRAGLPVALVIAGSGEAAYMAEARELQRQAGLGEEAVVWMGFVEGDEKVATLDDSDIYVLPSYSENFGVSVVEAMARELPVVVSDQVALHTDVGPAQAGLVTSCQVAPLMDSLSRLAASAGLRQQMGRNGAVLSQRFTPAAVASEMMKLYRYVVSRRETPAA
jgi:glycosyltransferase involved in cell wall biosynthesis